MMGGRRHRSGKKSRKMRGGNFYGAAGAIAPGAMQWAGVENVAATPDGALIANGSEMNPPKIGGRRRRVTKKTRKGGRKSRRVHRRRTMRGGVSVGGVGYAFNGTGVAGLQNAAGYNTNMGAAPTDAAGVSKA